LANGKVLVAGGYNYQAITSAATYDPSTQAWAAVGDLSAARGDHTATRLLNGRVLVAGGWQEPNALASAELYDQSSNAWLPAASLATARFLHSATLLPNGKVLVAGGCVEMNAPLATAELYDPTTDSWSPTGGMITSRQLHTAVMLPDGRVLVAGGTGGSNPAAGLKSAEIYDPAINAWSAAADMAEPRVWHAATRLPDGRVLVTAGSHIIAVYGQQLASTELYDPAANAWSQVGEMAAPRCEFIAVTLLTGKVLAAGGVSFAGLVASAEVYDPATSVWTPAGDMSVARLGSTAARMGDGSVLVVGGWAHPPGMPSAQVDIYGL
jgi:N-acetylneuraminic acid mutarotase